MTCRLTFCMSTFWLNSAGNLVLLRSLASTPVAMVGNSLVGMLQRAQMWSTEPWMGFGGGNENCGVVTSRGRLKFERACEVHAYSMRRR